MGRQITDSMSNITQMEMFIYMTVINNGKMDVTGKFLQGYLN